MAGTPMAKGMAMPAASRPRKMTRTTTTSKLSLTTEASATSSITALPSTISSIVAPTTITVSGIQSGVASSVLACASRRYELRTNCTKYQLVSAI